MTFQDVSAFIQSIGFPAAICCYLLYKYGKQMEKLTEAIQQLIQAVAIMEKSIEEHDKP